MFIYMFIYYILTPTATTLIILLSEEWLHAPLNNIYTPQ